MTRTIETLLERARQERAELGFVLTDTMMRLAAEGYMLEALDYDTKDIDQT